MYIHVNRFKKIAGFVAVTVTVTMPVTMSAGHAGSRCMYSSVEGKVKLRQILNPVVETMLPIYWSSPWLFSKLLLKFQWPGRHDPAR